MKTEQVWIYQVNEDNSCAIANAWLDDPIPEGWAILPVEWKDRGILYYENGVFREQIVTREDEDKEIANYEKVEKKMRELAIKELKKDGELPADYKEK